MVSYELCHNFYKSLSIEQRSDIFDQDTELAKLVKSAYKVALEHEQGYYGVYD